MDTISILLSIISVITAGLSLFIIRGEVNSSNKIFSLFILSISFWTMGLLFFRLTDDLDAARIISNVYYIVAGAIPALFLHFSLIFPSRKIKNRIVYISIYAPLIFMSLAIAINSDFVLKDLYFLAGSRLKSAQVNSVGYIVYSVYFVGFLLISYVNLFRSYFKSTDERLRTQLKFVFIGTIVPYLVAMFFDLILPPFNYTLIWIGPLMAFAVVWSIMYAVYKHHLLNSKVITAELFTTALWVFILAKTLLTDSQQERYVNIALLLVTIIVGVLLIRSVRKEVKQRERIEKLATDLEAANKRLTELDRQKSEFVSFASHQLRAPLTAMKGYGSLLLEGDMGELPAAARDGIERIYDSTKTLVSIVDDYLNVSRIELGTMKYTFETIDLKMMVEDVIAELRPNIEKRGLKFAFKAEEGAADYRTTADRDKLKQVIANLIDNSVKYTPSGTVDVTLGYDKPKHALVFKVKDTGIGIDPEVLPKLFQKFSRAENGTRTNIKGTGLGLFVAKQIVEAHHGSIRAESPGEGKGSSFIVELEPFRKA